MGQGRSLIPKTHRRSSVRVSTTVCGNRDRTVCYYAFIVISLLIRKRFPALHTCDKECLDALVIPESAILLVRRWQPGTEELLFVASFASEATTALVPIPTGHWIKTLDAAANIYGGDAGVLGLPTVLDGKCSQSMTFTPFAFAIYWRDPHAA